MGDALVFQTVETVWLKDLGVLLYTDVVNPFWPVPAEAQTFCSTLQAALDAAGVLHLRVLTKDEKKGLPETVSYNGTFAVWRSPFSKPEEEDAELQWKETIDSVF